MAAVGALAQPVVPAIDVQPTAQTFCGRVWEKLFDAWTGIKDVAHRTWVAVRDFFVAKYEWVKEKWSGKPVEVITPPPAQVPPVQQEPPAQEVPLAAERREVEEEVLAQAPPPAALPLQQEVQPPQQQLLAEFVPYPEADAVRVEVPAAQQGPQEVPPPAAAAEGGGNCVVM